MAAAVTMPQLGETVVEGKILSWFKAVGDTVEVGDKLFEVETDKVTVDVEAVASGKLREIHVEGGQTVKVGAVVATIGVESEGTGAGHSAAGPHERSKHRLLPFDEVATPTETFGSCKAPGGLRITPLARRLIAQNGLDLGAIAATIKARSGKRIVQADVQRALAERQSTPSEPASRSKGNLEPSGELVPFSAIRRVTSDRLTESWREIPHVYQGIEVDFTAVEQTRVRSKEAFRNSHGMALTFLPFVARATCIALREFPNINGSFENGGLYRAREINLGIAVDLTHNGLVVPVVRNAGDLTLEGIAKAIGKLIEKARANRLTVDDHSGASYSITNNGSFGTMFTTPIINRPQVAILSMDAVRKRPAVVSTSEGDFIAPRLVGILGQSFDHRAFDGAYSAAYLSRLKSIIETRNWSEEWASPQ